MHTSTHAHVHTCTRAHVHTCTRAHIHTSTHAHTDTCTLAHVHTWTRRALYHKCTPPLILIFSRSLSSNSEKKSFSKSNFVRNEYLRRRNRIGIPIMKRRWRRWRRRRRRNITRGLCRGDDTDGAHRIMDWLSYPVSRRICKCVIASTHDWNYINPYFVLFVSLTTVCVVVLWWL